jgi:hypothetical protein
MNQQYANKAKVTQAPVISKPEKDSIQKMIDKEECYYCKRRTGNFLSTDYNTVGLRVTKCLDCGNSMTTKDGKPI